MVGLVVWMPRSELLLASTVGLGADFCRPLFKAIFSHPSPKAPQNRKSRDCSLLFGLSLNFESDVA